jgi:hypothetical protein
MGMLTQQGILIEWGIAGGSSFEGSFHEPLSGEAEGGWGPLQREPEQGDAVKRVVADEGGQRRAQGGLGRW